MILQFIIVKVPTYSFLIQSVTVLIFEMHGHMFVLLRLQSIYQAKRVFM